MRWGLTSLLFVIFLSSTLTAAELVLLDKQNWKEYAVKGKEADCIYGDYVLRNDRIAAVIAAPTANRNANMTVRNVGWAIIDLTERTKPNDQLSAYYPGSLRHAFTSDKGISVQIDGGGEQAFEGKATQGSAISITCVADAVVGRPDVSVRYTLRDGDPFLLVETTYANPGDKQYVEELTDTIRADGTFEFGVDPSTSNFWANDDWFRQAYGIVCPDYTVEQEGNRGVLVRYKRENSPQINIAGGSISTFARRLFPAASLLQVRGIANQLAGQHVEQTKMLIMDARGPVRRARVEVTKSGLNLGSGRTDNKGRIRFPIEPGEYQVSITGLGRPQKVVTVSLSGVGEQSIQMEPCGYVVARISTAEGNPTPCKVSFQGFDGVGDPDFGPTSAVTVKNLRYSPNGSFRQEIAPGKYRVIVSYGPEHDAVFRDIEVRAGEDTLLEAQLKRSVDTSGWVSADFHSHSSPSGDNTCSQRARVLNLLCEHVEFCPCTEHNRIDSYVPHLRRLKVEHLMATCSGMELTGQPLPINHQNAFPLKMIPRTQDNGAPKTDENPIVQIERLAMWDNASDKLVQINHPNLVQMIGDRDENGMADGGFAKMFNYMDVIEVHPLQTILARPGTEEFAALRRNPVFNWMQMLNLGYRVTGVVNTDAHYSFHESGGLRNFIRSSTDDPAKIDTLEMVHNSTRGNLVMSTGPFLTVEAKSGDSTVGPGEDLKRVDGGVELSIRVQCANWLDVNRVQVIVNGRFDPNLNFTRQANGGMFTDDVVKFEQRIPVKLEQDAHLIVCAAGEGIPIGPVMGPNWGKQSPMAISNPIYVDVDGDGFHANGDMLDAPLPIEQTELPQR